jgi:hypothetical protein
MRDKDLFKDEKPASTQTPAPTLQLKQVAASVSSIKLIAEQASAATQLPHEIPAERYHAYSQWGLNE